MVKALTANSQILEYIALGSSFIHCCLLLFKSEFPFEAILLLYFFVMANLLINNYYRGTRIHLWPLLTGFSFYTIYIIFDILEEITFYYYYLTCLVSLVIVYFFGTVENYQAYVTSGKYAVGLRETITKIGGNRLFIYYPVDKKDRAFYKDKLWAYDGEHMIKGLMKFGADILPANPFFYLLSVKQRVKVEAQVAKLPENDKHQGKYIPIVFSHGVGNTMSWFSTICKDLASQGHIVYSIEHNDGTALHHFNDQNQHKYYKNFDMRDQNKILTKLGSRVKEVYNLLEEINSITKTELGQEVNLDMDRLTVLGHGLGATTSIAIAAKDQRVKKVITLDPWLTPIKDEIQDKQIKISQPHCSINSDNFQANLDSNWQLLNSLYHGKKSDNNLLGLLNGMGHMAFTDLPLILQLELRLIMFTPSFAQVFRSQENLRLILSITKAFLIKNDMCKESGNYEELIKRLESTKDVNFDIK